MSTESFFGMDDFQRGKYGWAEIIQPDGSRKLYRRATTVAGYLDDLNGLIEWKQAMTAAGVAKSKSLQANLSLLDWYTDKMKVKELVRKAFAMGGGEDAADVGTAFHRLVELHEGGTEPDPSVELPEGFAAGLEAYKAFKSAWGITTAGSEVKVVDDANEIAGTADLIFTFASDVSTPFGTIKAGEGIIGDVKTGSVSELSGLKMGMQLGIYSHGDLYDVPTGERLSWPVEMNSDIGVILKVDLKTGEVIPWWLNLAEAYKYVAQSMQVAETRKKGKTLISQAGEPGEEHVEKLGAREVGKLITAATCVAELENVKAKHGDVFTETMTERYNKRHAEMSEKVAEAVAEVEEIVSKPAKEDFIDVSDLQKEASDILTANKALGAATTVEELKAAWKAHAKVMTDEQKEFAKSQAEKLKAIEEAHAAKADETPEPAGQGEPLTGNIQPGVEELNLDDEDEPPFGSPEDDAPAIEPFSVEDAKVKAQAVANGGELRELWREFNRALKSGKSTPEAMKVITDRAADLTN